MKSYRLLMITIHQKFNQGLFDKGIFLLYPLMELSPITKFFEFLRLFRMTTRQKQKSLIMIFRIMMTPILLYPFCLLADPIFSLFSQALLLRLLIIRKHWWLLFRLVLFFSLLIFALVLQEDQCCLLSLHFPLSFFLYINP